MNKFKNLFFTFIIIFIFVFVANLTYNLAEPKAYDFMTKHVLTQKLPFDKIKKTYGSDDIVLVVIDAKTVEKYRWPWKRENYSKIFEYFNYSKPKLLIYDAIITTVDTENPESDKKFFNTINKFDNLIVGFMPRFANWENQETGAKIDEKLNDNDKLQYEALIELRKEYGIVFNDEDLNTYYDNAVKNWLYGKED